MGKRYCKPVCSYFQFNPLKIEIQFCLKAVAFVTYPHRVITKLMETGEFCLVRINCRIVRLSSGINVKSLEN